MAEDFAYIGTELELFAQAQNWKRYFHAQLQPMITGDVLEVGAGLGGTTTVFQSDAFTTWTCLEPDAQLLAQLEQRMSQAPQPKRFRYQAGTLGDLPAAERYDAILYIDVLEHIAEDGEEVARASERLKPGGRLIVLSPAYPWLFSPFDAHIGHHRRYTLGALKRLTPAGCRVERGFYLDSVGMGASAANRLLLRASLPTAKQIAFWDRVLVRASRWIDPLVMYRLGRSVVIVWQKG